jgi:hypothetical protein
MNKPVVYFSYIGFAVKVGSSAHIYALNHPKLGTQRVTTSTVIEVKKDDNIPGGTAEFETLNTRYVHIAMPDADENVEIAPSPNALITSSEVDW